jgi:hypothetical protein
MIASRDVDLGLWAAWKLRMPLRVNGHLVPVDDDIGQAVQARLGQPSDGPVDLATLGLDDDAMGSVPVAMRCALAMARAAYALAAIGAKTGLLPSPAAGSPGAHSPAPGLRPDGASGREPRP